MAWTLVIEWYYLLQPAVNLFQNSCWVGLFLFRLHPAQKQLTIGHMPSYDVICLSTYVLFDIFECIYMYPKHYMHVSYVWHILCLHSPDHDSWSSVLLSSEVSRTLRQRYPIPGIIYDKAGITDVWATLWMIPKLCQSWSCQESNLYLKDPSYWNYWVPWWNCSREDWQPPRQWSKRSSPCHLLRIVLPSQDILQM